MLKITEQCWAKKRSSTRANGGTYESGWIMLSQLKNLVQTAENAGLDAVGMSPRSIKTTKFDGSVIEITPFKLPAKKTA